jgi:UDP-N-acetylglucosamine transferase subunit ALG13
MIFVTVGTHEQQFNRLVECVDQMKEKGLLQEEVIIQTGFSTYEPKYCTWQKLLPFQQMVKNVEQARIVITHGGPSSFIMPLQIGKIPIVVPRQKQYEEHVNDHQVDFCRAVSQRQGNIILAEEMEALEQAILNYDEITAGMTAGQSSNNAKFNEAFGALVEGLFQNK